MIVQEPSLLHYTAAGGPVSQARSQLLQALFGMQSPPPAGPDYSKAMPDPVALNKIYQANKNKPMGLGGWPGWQTLGSSDNIPGTGYFGTAVGGTPWAVGAAPGPNQFEPM
jgi:hypothetical protein